MKVQVGELDGVKRVITVNFSLHLCEMSVDLNRGETLPIHINMTFPSLPCDVLSVDAIDMSGKHEVDLDTNIWKEELKKHMVEEAGSSHNSQAIKDSTS
ncbi:uncharacterized protein LOC131601605 isoform X2 [Vicia villosa]|nr:uncharacterized protein LOC131601605 isoform X2 [Vicia villosa]XP_058729451.1 uncharacterized protein LOC131601605 isoform X2 [Vicia villosa]XP_058729452.1 uncharacterized protein LOC131601605 isoform X2 [Vicia villosa]